MTRCFDTNISMSSFIWTHYLQLRKGGKSSREHTCCQLFVTDKGFLYVVPMSHKSDTLSAIKDLQCKLGHPKLCCRHGWGTDVPRSEDVFCNEIVTSLCALEEGTLWSNCGELYIGLMKEAVRKDMREAGSPLCFWDYCVEHQAWISNLCEPPL